MKKKCLKNKKYNKKTLSFQTGIVFVGLMLQHDSQHHAPPAVELIISIQSISKPQYNPLHNCQCDRLVFFIFFL